MRKSVMLLVFLALSLPVIADEAQQSTATTMTAVKAECARAATLRFPVPGSEKLFRLPSEKQDVRPMGGTCSGADCGCDIEEAACQANCPPQGAPGWISCYTACGAAYRDCAKACCA